jgi:hypothetical protein
VEYDDQMSTNSRQTSMTDFDKDERDTQEWRAVVGKVIVCFGELELITYKCLAHIPSDKIVKTTSRLSFAQRVDLITEILEGRNPVASQVSAFVEMLKKAKDLAKVRNDIAHNPVMLNIFVHKTSGDILLERSIATVRGDRFIDLASAKEFADEVEDLAATMWLQIGKLAQTENLGWMV